METSSPQDTLQSSKLRVIKVFRRQLALPLLGNESVLQEFDTLLSDICVEADVTLIDPESLKAEYERALEERESRMTYESHITSTAFKSLPIEDQVKCWNTYIKLEVDDNKISRAQRLFERAVLQCYKSLEDLIASVTSRAVTPCYYDGELWKYR